MRKALMTSALALAGLAAAPATAMPFPPLSDGPAAIAPVAYGCGPGWTRGPYGGCHPMRYAYVVPAPRAYGYYGYRAYAHPYYRHCWWRAGVRVCN